MAGPLAPGLSIAPSPIEGKGCFATQTFQKAKKIAEYTGELISRAEIARRVKRRRRHRICAIDSYWAIDGSRGGNGTHYINHSCAPNCYLKVIAGHVLFFALRDIAPGDEILLDYVSTWHPDTKRCTCGAPTCRGRINK